jgi:hypothetical protein
MTSGVMPLTRGRALVYHSHESRCAGCGDENQRIDGGPYRRKGPHRVVGAGNEVVRVVLECLSDDARSG